MQLDKERLEKLAPQLSAQGLDPESLPEPGSDEWRNMIRDLSLRDPVLAQSTAGLVFDPTELTKSSLVDQQATRSQARGGLGKMLSPLMKTKTANGDEVPNTALTRNLVIGGAVLLGAAFWFGIPHAQPAKVSSTSSSGSGTRRPTSSGQPTSTTSSSGGVGSPTHPASSGSGGVKDTTTSPALSSNHSDPTGLGSTDTQAAPSQNAVPTSPVMPVSTPSDPTGFQPAAPTAAQRQNTLAGNGAVPTPTAPAALPTARVMPMVVRTPVPPTGAGPVRLSQMKTTPNIPAAPKPRLVELHSGAASRTEASVPVRRLVASSGNSGSTPASNGSGTSARGLKSSAATSDASAASADQAGASPRGGLLNTAAVVPSAQVIALKVIAPMGAPAAAQLVHTQAASTSSASPAALQLAQAAPSASGGGQGGAQSVTPSAGRPGLGLSSTASQNAAAGTPQYGLLQSAANQTATTQGNNTSASAAPGRQPVGLLSQGPAPSAAPSNPPSSNAPANSTPPAAGSTATPAATSYGLKDLGPTRSTPTAPTTIPSLTAAAPSPASPAAPPAPVAQAPASPPYPVGQPLAAKLVLGVVAVDGTQSTVPVFARTDDGATWRGTATLDGRKRLQIQFSAVLRNGAEQAITADAYGSDGQPGLAASVRITTPTLAADLLSGVFSGVKAFADATINQRNVSVQAGTGNTGNVVTSTAANTPNFWLVTAGNALGQFQVPQNKATIVNVAEVKAGTALNLVVRGEQR